jgi:hypothetical protein
MEMNMLTTERYLDELEKIHRLDNGDRGFCYVAVLWDAESLNGPWRLAIATKNYRGYYPISDDYFVGSKQDMEAEAERLNQSRLGILKREAMMIVAASMTAS